MLRPDLFGGLATHAGDALFENCYLADFRAAARTLASDYDNSPQRFWEDFHARQPISKPGDHVVLNVLCMAACYSANEDGSYELPFHLPGGKLRDDVWERWLAWDPVRMVPRHADELRGLQAIWIDAGYRDEFYLDLGAIAFRDALAEIGVTDMSFELFDGTHGNLTYRYPMSLAYLAERLAPA
jgi:hypothetical protein